MTRHSRETEADRLLALSEKVGRVAESLAELALERDSLGKTNPGSDSDFSAESVEWLIRARRERARYVPTELFGEPVWDMMLYLLHAEMTHRYVSVASVCLATGLPEAIGRRWLNTMIQHELAVLREAPNDDEELVQLMPAVGDALRHYFRDVVKER
jgi:hypothetical protein